MIVNRLADIAARDRTTHYTILHVLIRELLPK